MNKRIVLLLTDRYSINANDFYMFYRRTAHTIVGLLHSDTCPQKSWWIRNRFNDKARDCLFDRMDFSSLRLMPWSTEDELLRQADKLDFDYVCMGNGSGKDQQRLIQHVGLDRCLFTEYGWLPWSRHFYISRKGCGYTSEITDVDESVLQAQPLRTAEIEALRASFGRGWPVFRKDFIYVPLQKDVNDFKFTLTHFRSNEEFLDFVHEIVPRDIKVLVKRHPLYKKKYNFRKYGRFIDISGRRLNKSQLYARMLAMVCINSTSILEAILFNARVFAYGKDIYMNKGVVHYREEDPRAFAAGLSEPPPRQLCDAFVSLLLDRQIDRRRCLKNDARYISDHYWNRAI